MQELRANTQVIVRMGPFVDVGDGFTPQTDITLGGNEAELLKNASVEVDISGRTWTAITNCRGWYDLTLTTDDTNTEGLLTVVVQDDSDCLPVHKDFMVLSQAAWDSKYVAKDSGYLDVNIKAVSEDTTAADDLELLIENSKGTDHKILLSTDAQDLSATMDVNTKTITNGIIVAATLGADCITAAKIANDAIAAEHLNATACTKIIDDFETQSQADPTGFHVNVKEVNGTGQTANDNGADINAILIDTAVIGALGVGLTAIPWNADWDTEVESEVADALVAINLDHLLKIAVANNADMTTEVTDGTVISNIMSATSDTSTYVVADDSLQGISEGAAGGGATPQEVWEYGTRVLTANTNLNDPTAAAIVNEWEAQSQADPTGFHVNVKEVNGTSQTANDNSADINAILVDTGTTLPATLSTMEGKIDTVDGIVDTILIDTNELQTNQGGWITATGFSTHNAAAVTTAMKAMTGITAGGTTTFGNWCKIVAAAVAGDVTDGDNSDYNYGDIDDNSEVFASVIAASTPYRNVTIA